MVDALWTQLGGITYTAAEDRRLISAVSTVGVVNGLVTTNTTGSGISVSEGTAVVSDGSGGAYVAYTTAATTFTLATSASPYTVYMTVSATTGQSVLLAQTTVPSDPSVAIITINNSTGTPVIPNAGVSLTRALPPNVSGDYLKLAGGTVTGATTFDQGITTNGLITATGGLYADGGVRLGGTYPTARHYCRVTSPLAPASGVNRVASGLSSWQEVRWETPASSDNVTDYATSPFTSASPWAFRCPVPGYYMVSGTIATEQIAGQAVRRVSVSVWDTAARFRMTSGSTFDDTYVSYTAMVPVTASNQHVRVEFVHNTGTTMDVIGGQCQFRLIQAN